jgi:hypothetical protein
MKLEDDRTPGASLHPDFHYDDRDFFERNTEPRKEIVEGLIREQQIVAFAGP